MPNLPMPTGWEETSFPDNQNLAKILKIFANRQNFAPNFSRNFAPLISRTLQTSFRENFFKFTIEILTQQLDKNYKNFKGL
jgi:hypothetical protein